MTSTTVLEARGRDSATVAVVGGSGATIGWGAAICGAFVIAALSVILLALGAGFGLSSVSPWPGSGASLTTFTVVSAVWLIVVQWLSSAIGGYIAGRLGRAPSGLHPDEANFRDTVQGVLAWAVAAIVTGALLASAVTTLLGGSAAGSAASPNGSSAASSNYFVDSLYRSGTPDAKASADDVRAETGRILAKDLAAKQVPADDRAYMAKLVVARTGISQEDAQKRVDETVAKARQAADETRKAGGRLALFTGFSMLIGAFIAGIAGKIGGDHRDRLTI
ncbi:MAG TPA: hypothetical protein VFW46_13610 [Stellaceae bacterium]|nr:hypothetical protein [Stellaceae bacterium]